MVQRYNYAAVLAGSPPADEALFGRLIGGAGAPVQRSCSFWGRICHRDSCWSPRSPSVTRSSMPTVTGPYRIDALDGAGGSIFSISFAGDLVADLPSDDRHFAFAIPLSAACRVPSRRAQAVRSRHQYAAALRSAAAVVASGRAFAPMQPAGATAAVAVGGVRLDWNAATHPMVMVRDAATGEVLSFARGGSMNVMRANAGGELELIFSDGVRSTTRRDDATIIGAGHRGVRHDVDAAPDARLRSRQP